MNFKKLFVHKDLTDNNSFNVALLLLRFYAGFTIMNAGLDKLPLKDWMVEQVTSIGFPFPVVFAWIATFSEFAFGFLLVIGAFTRISGLFLAFTIGVAAFEFHKVSPLIEMHITQYFFWIFFLFIFSGGGKFSIDHYVSSSKVNLVKFVPLLLFPILLLVGLYIEFSSIPEIVETKTEITSISISGSFNDWDPKADELTKIEENSYSTELEFLKSGLIEFKFNANNSWDINYGEENQSSKGFPLNGKIELDEGNNTNNIKAYIPNPGNYRFMVNLESLNYSLDSVSTNN